MQDSAPHHTAKRIKQFLDAENIEIMKWPAQSPDLNLIKNLWKIQTMEDTGRKVDQDATWEISDILRQARAHIDIKGGLSTCPFSSSRESALFSGEFFFYKLIYVYMCSCVFLIVRSFPCQTNKKMKISGRVRKWDSVEFWCFSPLCVSAQARAAQQCSTHWSAHAHHRQTENRRSEALPPSPVVFVLVWRWVVINKRLSYLCLEFTANYPKDKRQI